MFASAVPQTGTGLPLCRTMWSENTAGSVIRVPMPPRALSAAQAIEARGFAVETVHDGASALRQLVAWVGEPEFLAGIHEYFTKHAWGNTQLDDLLVELEKSSGRDLSGWTQEWLRTSGVRRSTVSRL